MRILLFVLSFLLFAILGHAQVLTVTSTSASGRFNSCVPASAPVVTVNFVSGSGSSFSNGAIVCNDICGTTTIKVNISNLKWYQGPEAQWLHGIFLPANAGYTVSGINLPPGFISYNGGCTGGCPTGILTGPGFYFDATGNNSCCTGAFANDGIPCNNYGDASLDCSPTFGFEFNMTFCNSILNGSSETFTLTGTPDGLTGCWNNNSVSGVHAVSFSLNTIACQALSAALNASPPIPDCSAATPNYFSTLSGGCGNGSTVSWWTDSVGGTQVGSGSPFNYDPAGSACPAGTTLYASCCVGGSTTCTKRYPITIPGTCNPPITITSVNSISGNCITLSEITSVSVQNASGPVIYTLQPGGISNSTGVFTGLNLASYTVTVSDGSPCSASTIVNFTPIALPNLSVNSNPPLCSSSNDGDITIIASGTSSPYSYSLNGGPLQPSGTFPLLAAGTYTVLASDANGCTATSIVVLTALNPIQIIPSQSAILCFGGTATLTVNTTGGSGILQYSLNNGPLQTNNQFTTLGAGTYTILVQDASSCTASTVYSVTQPTQLTASVAVSTINCAGGTATLTITASGGTLPSYQYSINNALFQTYNVYSNIAPGTYTVSAYDGNVCTYTTLITITAPPALTVSTNATTIVCNGQTADLTVTASGGTPAYSYAINGGGYVSSNVFTGLFAGTYTLTVKDANNCTKTSTKLITQPPILILTASAGSVTCNGDTTQITAVASGGAGSYQYSLNGGVPQTSGLFQNVTGGIYTVQVQDANGCSTTTVVSITEPLLLTITSSFLPISCSASSTDITLNATGGTTPTYQYSLNNGPQQTNPLFTNVIAGNYTATVTDANGCTATTVMNIVQPQTITLNLTSTSIPCFGGSSTLTASAIGGTPLYQFSINGGALQNNGTFSTLPAATYTVLAQDANGCTQSSLITITEPLQLSVNASSSSISCSGASSTITATVTGGSGTYQYSLNGGPFQSSGIFLGNTFGSYTVQVVDANSCSSSTQLIIAQPLPLGLTLSASPILCFGGTSTITCSATGGTVPAYQYSLNGGPNQLSNSFTSVVSGNYTVQVTDANNCTTLSTVNITQPTALTVAASAPLVLCANDVTAITATASGGITATYQYALNGGSWQSSSSFSGISAGSYTVSVLDGNNCTATTTITIAQPSPLTVSVSATSISCFGGFGTLTCSASGGTATGYQFSLNGGVFQTSPVFNSVGAASYTIVVKDANNCTASTAINLTQPALLTASLTSGTLLCNGQTTTLQANASGGSGIVQYSLNGSVFQPSSSFPNQGAGSYTVVAQDANGCTASSSLLLTQPALLTVSAVATSILCQNGTSTLTITAIGGTGTYQYQLNGGSNQLTPVYSNLVAGNYTVLVTDANGCTSSTTINISQPSLLTLSLSAPAIACANNTSTITALAGGGSSGYQYSLNSGPNQSSPLFSSIGAGSYTVQVTDANGCTASSNITLTQPLPLSIISVSSTIPTCIPGNDASLTVTASGGTTNLQYSVNGSAWQAGMVFTNLGVSTYTITVQDANGCTISSVTAITNPNSPIITSASSIPSTCFGLPNGSLTVVANGSSALTYTLLPSSISNTTGNFTSITAGTYTVQVIDASQCSASTLVVVTQPPLLTLTNLNLTPTSCNTSQDGGLSVTVTGGTGAIGFVLNPGAVASTTGMYTGLSTGFYTITCTDANGCTVSGTALVSSPPPITFNGISTTNETCFNSGNGTISVAANGGTGSLTYTLLPLSITNSTGIFNSLPGNTYTIQVVDANGCSIASTVTILNPLPVVFSSVASTNIQCVGNTNGTITVQASGGNSSLYTYLLTPGGLSNTTGAFTGLGVNTYTVQVTDANGCSNSTLITISTPSTLQFNLDSLQQPICANTANGGIYTTTTGGTLPYSYMLQPGAIASATGDYPLLLPGNYTITITDGNGCSLSIGPISLIQPNPILLNIVSQLDATCYGDSNGSFTVQSSGGSGIVNLTLQPNLGSFLPPGTFNSLSANNYTVQATDGNGCTETIVAVVNQNANILFDSVFVNPPTCYGDLNGSIAIFGNGGTTPLLYQLNFTNSSASGFYSPIVPGTYTVSVIDQKGCRADSVVQMIEPTLLEFESIEITPVECDEDKNAQIIAVGTGGSPGYTYILQPLIKVNSTGVFTELNSSTYTLTLKDSRGCELDTIFTILPPDQYMILNISKKDVGCYGIGKEGEATVIVTNGLPPYLYTWSTTPVQTTATVNGLSFGYYTVEVEDARGCQRKETMYIKPGSCCEELFIPNAFSPNEDGMNDVFRVTTATGIEIIQFSVYNRWGGEVWSTLDINRGWDGTHQDAKQDMNTFYYVLKYKCLHDGNIYLKKGDVTLMR